MFNSQLRIAPSHLRQNFKLCTVDAMTLQLSKAEKKGVAFLEHEGTVSLFSCEARLTSQDVCFLTSQPYCSPCLQGNLPGTDYTAHGSVLPVMGGFTCIKMQSTQQGYAAINVACKSFKIFQVFATPGLHSLCCFVLIPQHRQRISKKNRFSIRFLSGFMLCFYLSLRFALIALREPLEKRLPPLS